MDEKERIIDLLRLYGMKEDTKFPWVRASLYVFVGHNIVIETETTSVFVYVYNLNDISVIKKWVYKNGEFLEKDAEEIFLYLYERNLK